MIVRFDPEKDGHKLSEAEIQRLRDLEPKFMKPSIDAPELTDELVRKMKEDPQSGRISKIMKKERKTDI